MTILADDANYGGLVGTCLVGAVRVEDSPASFRVLEIPIAAFQSPAYERGDYLDEAAKSCLQLLADLKVPPTEPVHLCRGWVFERAESAVRRAGYNVHRGRIEDPLQTLIEQASVDYLRQIGVDVRLGMKFGQHFFACLAWLKGGNVNGRALPDREKLAKTGWATYQPWATLSVARAKAEAARIRNARKRARFSRHGGEWD